MDELFVTRVFAYSFLPLILAFGHMWIDRRSMTPARRIELILLYLFAVSVGANGLGGAYGHLVLSDLVAEGIGWEAGSPFQLEMGYANLALGVLGLVAMGRRDGFRLATILAVTVIGAGATSVHIVEIVQHGNLAPGNTIQNVGNLLDPILLIVLSAWTTMFHRAEIGTEAFQRWQIGQQLIPGMAAFGVGFGFGMGYAIDALFIATVGVTLISVAIGFGIRAMLNGRSAQPQPEA